MHLLRLPRYLPGECGHLTGRARDSLQLSIYAMAYEAMTGRLPDAVQLHFLESGLIGRAEVDPKRLAVGGFSDGASYALSLGLTNGDLFTHVLAFSPGFMAPGDSHGKPRLFLSHGTDDRVLPIDQCSRRVVPQVRRAGYDVTYREFDGPHTVPEEVAREAVDWFNPS